MGSIKVHIFMQETTTQPRAFGVQADASKVRQNDNCAVKAGPKSTKDKISDLLSLAPELDQLKQSGKKVVHCHGVFDLLHIGHIRHFEEAKKHGDILVVTLTADQYVNKGPHRPAFGQDLRAEAVAA